MWMYAEFIFRAEVRLRKRIDDSCLRKLGHASQMAFANQNDRRGEPLSSEAFLILCESDIGLTAAIAEINTTTG
jgi:hypothetical protein